MPSLKTTSIMGWPKSLMPWVLMATTLPVFRALRVEQKTGWGQGSDSVALFAERSSEEEEAEVVAAKAWRRVYKVMERL